MPVEPEHVVISNDPIVNQPAKMNIEMPLRRLAISDDYVYLHDSDFQIRLNNCKSFKEVISHNDY